MSGFQAVFRLLEYCFDWALRLRPGDEFPRRLPLRLVEQHEARAFHAAQTRAWWRLDAPADIVERIRKGTSPTQSLCDVLPHLRERRQRRNGLTQPLTQVLQTEQVKNGKPKTN